MTALVILTGVCALGVLFLLRFLIALCQEHAPAGAVHLLNDSPAPTDGDEPDAGSEEESLELGDSHTVRTRRDFDRPAAPTARWNALEAVPSARCLAAKRSPANKVRRSSWSIV